jgi:hypothetical protein
MKWYREPVLKLLRSDPPVGDLDRERIVVALRRVGCTVVETEGGHLSVERGGRLARFQQGAGGTALTYQLSSLRTFLEETA